MAEVKDSPERTPTEAIDESLNNNMLKIDDRILARALEHRFPEIEESLQEALKGIND